MDDAYRLILRDPEAGSPPRSREEIEVKWQRIPTLVPAEAGRYVFGVADEHGQMDLCFLPEMPSQSFERIEIQIPRAWVHARGPQVFALVFMTAEWIGFEVFDPQIESVLQKDVVLQGLVAMRQAALEKERGKN